jgi:hypothetical protein
LNGFKLAQSEAGVKKTEDNLDAGSTRSDAAGAKHLQRRKVAPVKQQRPARDFLRRAVVFSLSRRPLNFSRVLRRG